MHIETLGVISGALLLGLCIVLGVVNSVVSEERKRWPPVELSATIILSCVILVLIGTWLTTDLFNRLPPRAGKVILVASVPGSDSVIVRWEEEWDSKQVDRAGALAGSEVEPPAGGFKEGQQLIWNDGKYHVVGQ